jgi:branched-chain amino acid transport system substrate-binding protein
VLGTLEFDAKGDIKQIDYVVYKWDSKGGYTEINPKGS